MNDAWKKVIAVVTSASFIGFLTLFEGTKFTPYKDTGGIYTVCTGQTGEAVVKGKVYTKEECDALLNAELNKKAMEIRACLTQVPTIYEFGAFVDFGYNVGTSAFCKSSIAREFNKGNNVKACNNIMKWKYVGGKDCNLKSYNCSGIIKRRLAEKNMCLGINKNGN